MNFHIRMCISMRTAFVDMFLLQIDSIVTNLSVIQRNNSSAIQSER